MVAWYDDQHIFACGAICANRFIAFCDAICYAEGERKVYNYDVKVILLPIFIRRLRHTLSERQLICAHARAEVTTIAWSYLDLLEAEFLFIALARINWRWRRHQYDGTESHFSTFAPCSAAVATQLKMRENTTTKNERFLTLCHNRPIVGCVWCASDCCLFLARLRLLPLNYFIFPSFSSFSIVRRLRCLSHCVRFSIAASPRRHSHNTIDCKYTIWRNGSPPFHLHRRSCHVRSGEHDTFSVSHARDHRRRADDK